MKKSAKQNKINDLTKELFNLRQQIHQLEEKERENLKTILTLLSEKQDMQRTINDLEEKNKNQLTLFAGKRKKVANQANEELGLPTNSPNSNC